MPFDLVLSIVALVVSVAVGIFSVWVNRQIMQGNPPPKPCTRRNRKG